MKKDINQKWFFDHTPDKVWDYLTDPKLIAEWLMESDFQPVVGHEFKFTGSGDNCIYDGIAYCKVLDVDPFKHVSYSWRTGPGNGVITVHSVVSWTLTAKDNGTELELSHTGFTDIKDADAHREGWTQLGERFVNRLNEVYQNETTNT
ncbi:MAG: polyketide cyclase [Bacteroidetes bacterium]|nr:MAG: polyketide cyclase [Bacteroidota bacterium]